MPLRPTLFPLPGPVVAGSAHRLAVGADQKVGRLENHIVTNRLLFADWRLLLPTARELPVVDVPSPDAVRSSSSASTSVGSMRNLLPYGMRFSPPLVVNDSY